MNAAASSWWTSTNRTLSWWRRSPSMIPLIPSPGSPNTVSTPHSASRSTSSSDAILSMRTPRVARRTAKSVCGLASRGAWETATGCRTPWEAGNGDEEAGHRRQAQRQEGPGRGEAEALDRQHAGQQAQHPGQAGRGRGPAQAYRRVIAQDPPGAVRDRQAPEPYRPLQDGPGRAGPGARLQVGGQGPGSALPGRLQPGVASEQAVVEGGVAVAVAGGADGLGQGAAGADQDDQLPGPADGGVEQVALEHQPGGLGQGHDHARVLTALGAVHGQGIGVG